MVRATPTPGVTRLRYRRDGHVILRGVLPSATMALLTRSSERIHDTLRAGQPTPAVGYREYRGDDPSDSFRRIECLAEASPLLAAWFRQGYPARIAATLLGGPVRLFKDKLNLKLPGGAGYAAHLDGHFHWTDVYGNSREGWLEYADRFVNIVIPLDDSHRDNGCLEIAASSSPTLRPDLAFATRLAQLPDGGPGLSPQQERALKFTPQILAIGDVLCFDWRVPHRSAANTSAQARRILYLTYHLARHGEQRRRYFLDKAGSRAPLRAKGSI
ncbi:MAG: phytanoyl-CoA dioxygenase family protein [Chromatiales bacterium]|nr:phytanoyl-CoA dioxygenase family protein [Chromatiales bacterium]